MFQGCLRQGAHSSAGFVDFSLVVQHVDQCSISLECHFNPVVTDQGFLGGKHFFTVDELGSEVDLARF